jgi:pimeloyl-ACP methyl ester carboxylesterase
MAKTNGRTSGHGGVAHESAQVQNRNDGSTDTPKTTVSTTINDETAQPTRRMRAGDAFTRWRTYHSWVSYDPRLSLVGDGPPVVLVPGLDGTGLLFYRQVERLAKHYRVATFRLRDNATDMHTLVHDLHAIVQQLGPVTMIGESFGGALSLSYTLAHPDHVDRLVVLNSFPYFSPQARLQLGYHLLKAMPWGMMGVVRKLTAFRMHSPHTSRTELATFHELMRNTTREGYLSRLAILRNYDVRGRLPELQRPVLFVAADRDHLVPAVQQARLMTSLVPKAALRILEGHGHICLIAPDVDLSQVLHEWEKGV